MYLPPSYDASPDRRYPVVYMQDGWNAFDDATSFSSEWGADETAQDLAERGLEVIVVAVTQDIVPSSFKRLSEYGPWTDFLGLASGQGGQYAAFLAQTLKPFVDSRFRTLRDAPHTAVIGSSMGGLISLYTAFEYPRTFGFVGALSPALWFADGQMFRHLATRASPNLRVYTDIGSSEHMGVIWDSARFVRDTAHLAQMLESRVAAVRWGVFHGADHSETQWRTRLPAVLEWFLSADAPRSETTGQAR
ncbi:MAG: alpha/beta hydrolase [Pleurocapsa sp. SU_196_0]|nr:alpha/beta hydrolase [Pleurocapsa sp. SU_196_0]